MGHGIRLTGLNRCRIKGCAARKAALGLCKKHRTRHLSGKPLTEELTQDQKQTRALLGLDRQP